LNNAFSEAYAILKQLNDDEKQALHRYARISTIGASTRIENAQLTDLEVQWIDTILTSSNITTTFESHRHIIANKLSKNKERSIEEVAGCRSMLMLIHEHAHTFLPMTEKEIRGLHYELMSSYSKALPYAGRYKTQSNSIVAYNQHLGEQRTVFNTADAGPPTSIAMKELVVWYNQNLSLAPYPIAVICEFVYRFLAIHPFQDGNGRLGRGLLLIGLLHCQIETISHVAYYIAIDRSIEKHKEEYYWVLNRCSSGSFNQDPTKYHIDHFLSFIIKIVHESLEGINIFRANYKSEQTLSSTSTTVLQCFRENPEIRLTTKKLVEITDFPRRTIIYALNSLLKIELIQKYGAGAAIKYQLTF